ncbi:meteorin-like protein isoform X2 [Balearica regulorum gibbericeps]|uniref:meteorin-like protein isoform X2 n=1 Tax=Balearica regulorum gibbericeps TaxID=100784 RepID=UPI003F5F31C1
MRSAPAAGLLPLLLGLRLLLGGGAAAQYSSDLCNWKGSGLTHESHKKDVEQVYLRCSEGSIEWMYPTGALIVNLRPNTSPASYKRLTVCIKPFKDSAGANIYLEKTGELKLLVRDGDRSPSKVYCFGYDQGGLFIEATPQQDISRKITGFQYELMNKGIASDLHTVSEARKYTLYYCTDTRKLPWTHSCDMLNLSLGGLTLGQKSCRRVTRSFDPALTSADDSNLWKEFFCLGTP